MFAAPSSALNPMDMPDCTPDVPRVHSAITGPLEGGWAFMLMPNQQRPGVRFQYRCSRNEVRITGVYTGMSNGSVCDKTGQKISDRGWHAQSSAPVRFARHATSERNQCYNE